MWFRNRNIDQYVVDTSHLRRELEIAACRAALRLVAPDVYRFQCDVPWGNRDSWPDDVIAAATILAPLPENATPKQTYQDTGWITNFPETVWQAFVTFAPYAFSSDAWTDDMKPVVDINDEGTSLVVRVLPGQVRQFEQAVPEADVIPLIEWRRRPRRIRKASH